MAADGAVLANEVFAKLFPAFLAQYVAAVGYFGPAQGAGGRAEQFEHFMAEAAEGVPQAMGDSDSFGQTEVPGDHGGI